MKKSNLNFVIDFVLFILLGLLIGIGLLVKYVLISGAESWEKYGENYEFSWLGFDRHEWGTVHLIVGLVFFSLIALHIILHWKTIICLFKRFMKSKPLRLMLGILFSLLFVLLTLFAFIITPEKELHGRGRERLLKQDNETYHAPRSEPKIHTTRSDIKNEKQNTSKPAISDKKEVHRHNKKINSNIEIRGYMTLDEVAEKYDVSVDFLKQGMGFPSNVSGSERLGSLKKKYYFKMSELENLINNKAVDQ